MTRTTLALAALLASLFAGLARAEAQSAPDAQPRPTHSQPAHSPPAETSDLALLAAPAGPTTVHRADHGLVIAGAVVLSLGWGLNTLGAAAGEAAIQVNGDGNNPLWPLRYALSTVPVLGPVIWSSWALSAGDHVALALFGFGDALVQGAGLAMLIAGLIGYDEPVGQVAEGVQLVPMASSTGSGLMVDVRF